MCAILASESGESVQTCCIHATATTIIVSSASPCAEIESSGNLEVRLEFRKTILQALSVAALGVQGWHVPD
jgi:hypothetical protein